MSDTGHRHGRPEQPEERGAGDGTPAGGDESGAPPDPSESPAPSEHDAGISAGGGPSPSPRTDGDDDGYVPL